MGKKNKKVVPVGRPVLFGVPLGVKQLGKPLSVAFGVYPLADIEPVFVENSVEFNFTGLPYPVSMSPVWNEEVFTEVDKGAHALCFFVISDSTKVNDDNELVADLLPFKVGESRTWRNPKKGFLLEDAEETVQAQKELAEFYAQQLPGWGAFYVIEQVVDPAGLSDSVDFAVHRQIKNIVTG